MTVTTWDGSAEQLHDALGHFLNRGVRIQLIDEALAAERRATVEQMENEGVVTWDDDRHRARFLDEEAAR